MDDYRRQCLLLQQPLTRKANKTQLSEHPTRSGTGWGIRDLHEGVHTAAEQLPSTGLGQAVIDPLSIWTTSHQQVCSGLQSTASNIALRAAAEHKEHWEHTECSMWGRNRPPAALFLQRSSPIKMKYPNTLQGPSIIPLVQRNFI